MRRFPGRAAARFGAPNGATEEPAFLAGNTITDRKATMDISINPSEFDKIMTEIDRQLKASGYGIPQRPLQAILELSTRYSVPLSVTDPHPGFAHSSASFGPISARVHDWYDKRYGERIKVDWSPGRMAILIEDDLWVLKLPFILGSVDLTISRTVQSTKQGTNGKSAVYNVIDGVENLPQGRIVALPDNELEHVYEKFILASQAFGILEGCAGDKLMNSASADIAAAVGHLAAQDPEYGLSKWASLQAAEKMFKSAIAMSDGNYSNTHSLKRLAAEARSVGLSGPWEELSVHIQCQPGIRYGEEDCDRDTALIAHHATLSLAIMLREGGAAFQSSLALQWSY